MEMDEMIMIYSPSKIYEGNTQGLTYLYIVYFAAKLVAPVWMGE